MSFSGDSQVVNDVILESQHQEYWRSKLGSLQAQHKRESIHQQRQHLEQLHFLQDQLLQEISINMTTTESHLIREMDVRSVAEGSSYKSGFTPVTDAIRQEAIESSPLTCQSGAVENATFSHQLDANRQESVETTPLSHQSDINRQEFAETTPLSHQLDTNKQETIESVPDHELGRSSPSTQPTVIRKTCVVPVEGQSTPRSRDPGVGESPGSPRPSIISWTETPPPTTEPVKCGGTPKTHSVGAREAGSPHPSIISWTETSPPTMEPVKCRGTPRTHSVGARELESAGSPRTSIISWTEIPARGKPATAAAYEGGESTPVTDVGDEFPRDSALSRNEVAVMGTEIPEEPLGTDTDGVNHTHTPPYMAFSDAVTCPMSMISPLPHPSSPVLTTLPRTSWTLPPSPLGVSHYAPPLVSDYSPQTSLETSLQRSQCHDKSRASLLEKHAKHIGDLKMYYESELDVLTQKLNVSESGSCKTTPTRRSLNFGRTSVKSNSLSVNTNESGSAESGDSAIRAQLKALKLENTKLQTECFRLHGLLNDAKK